MKTVSNILGFIAILSCMASARPEDIGFVRIVHAVAPGTGKASILVNGRDLHPDGYELGQDTGGYGVKAGELRVALRKDGLRTGATRIRLQPGETTTLIAHAEQVPAAHSGDPPRWKIKFLSLPHHPVESGYAISFVSVCRSDETTVQLTREGRLPALPVSARRLAVTRMDAGRKAVEMGVFLGGRKLAHVSTDSPGNHVVILYDRADGVTQALSFYDAKFGVAG